MIEDKGDEGKALGDHSAPIAARVDEAITSRNVRRLFEGCAFRRAWSPATGIKPVYSKR